MWYEIRYYIVSLPNKLTLECTHENGIVEVLQLCEYESGNWTSQIKFLMS